MKFQMIENKLYKILLIFFVLALANITKSYSQDSCQIAIVEATAAFDNGNYQKVVDLLKDRINECDYSRDTKLQVYKLLVASYAEIDEIEISEKNALKFLKHNPEYDFLSTDPLTFKNSISKYSIRPNYTFGLDLNIMFITSNVIKSYKIIEDPNYTVTYKDKLSIPFNTAIQKHFTQRFSTCFEFKNYKIETIKNASFSNNYRYESIIKFSTFKLTNLNIYQIIRFNKISLNAFGGFYGYVSKSSEFSITPFTNNIQGEMYDIYNTRYLNVGYTSGLSLIYKIERFNLKIQARYSEDYLLLNRVENRYANPFLNINYLYVDDDIRFSQFEVLIGISYNFFYKIKHKYKK